MKTIKIILLFTILALFTSVPLVVEAAEAKDCSQFKKLHKKLICKTGGYTKDDDEGESFNEKYKTLADFVKKKEDSPKDKEKEKGESFNEKYNSLADIIKKFKKE